MMLRYVKTCIKAGNQKGWIRAPAFLHSTDTIGDFPGVLHGKSKQTAAKNHNPEPAKVVTTVPPPPKVENPISTTKMKFDSPTSNAPPEGCDNGNNNKNYKKYIWPLLVAVGALGGVYYYLGVRDSSKDKKITKKEVERVFKTVPQNASDIPNKAKYLLIGGGTASFTAFRAIKANDPKAKVLLISNENVLPYMRPPLSKEIWQYDKLPVDQDKLTFKQWNGKERSLYYEPPEFYLSPEKLDQSENGGVAVATGWTISRVDAEQKKAYVQVHGQEEREISYEKCLIATGCRPRTLPLFSSASKEVASRTILFRNIQDLQHLWKKLEDPSTKTVVIVGGGFLGSELACSLKRNENNRLRKVVQIFKESGNMSKVLPEYLAQWTSDRVRSEGIKVMANSEIQEVDWRDGKVVLRLNNKENVQADLVILAVGSEANTDLAEASKLEVDDIHGGFLVTAELEARKDLFVAGDAACFFDPLLGRRRVEHHDHAVISGRLAGNNMAGNSNKPYAHQSMFWSDLTPDLGYEAIGLVDAKLKTVGVFAKATDSDLPSKETENKIDPNVINEQEVSSKQDEKNYGKGVVFYLKGDKLVGIVLWNIFNRMHVARQVLALDKTYSDLNEVAKLFSIHDD